MRQSDTWVWTQQISLILIRSRVTFPKTLNKLGSFKWVIAQRKTHSINFDTMHPVRLEFNKNWYYRLHLSDYLVRKRFFALSYISTVNVVIFRLFKMYLQESELHFHYFDWCLMTEISIINVSSLLKVFNANIWPIQQMYSKNEVQTRPVTHVFLQSATHQR
jgi:hypothetical protein